MYTMRFLKTYSTAHALAWTLLCGGTLTTLDLILPAPLWTATAWKILRPADGEYPGCGATLSSASAGNNNKGMYYLTLEGTQAEIDCAETILDNTQERQ